LSRRQGLRVPSQVGRGPVPRKVVLRSARCAAAEDLLLAVLRDDGASRHAHDHRHGNHDLHRYAGAARRVHVALVHSGGDDGPVLALRRPGVDLPVPAAVPDRTSLTGETKMSSSHAYDPSATVRSYLLVFGALMLCTALTVAAAFVNMGALNNVIALTIA